MPETTMNTAIDMKARMITIHSMSDKEAEQYSYQKYPRIVERTEREYTFHNLRKNLEEYNPNCSILAINTIDGKTIGMMLVKKSNRLLTIVTIDVPNVEKRNQYKDDILKQFIKYCKTAQVADFLKLEEMGILMSDYIHKYGELIQVC